MSITIIRDLLAKEVSEFKSFEDKADHQKCYEHLARAHVLSQRSILLHLYVHWLMFKYALRRQDAPEVLGQLLRLFVTIPGHALGRVPRGNIGWSTVGLTEEMPIPKDLEDILEK